MWPFTKQKEKDARANYEFTKVDRDFSTELRKKNQELKMKEQQLEHEIRMRELQMQLQDLDYELNGTEEAPEGNTADTMLMTLFSQILNKQPAQQNNSITPQKVEQVEQVSLSDEQLLKMWNAVPKQYRIMSKAMTDERLKELLKQQLGNVNDETLSKALSIIRNVR